MFAKTGYNWTRQHKGTRDNIFSIEIDGNKKKRLLSSQKIMVSVIRKKNSGSKRLGRKRRLENETKLLEGDTNDTGLIEIPGAACV